MRARLCIALALTTAATGCGGRASAGDEPAVRSALVKFLHAVAAGDGQAACRQITPSGQANFETQIQTLLRAQQRLNCAQIVPLLGHYLPATEQAGLRTVSVRHARVTGNTATVAAGDITSTTGSVGGFAQTTRFRKVAGVWQID